MKIIPLTFALLLAAIALPQPVRAAEQVSVRAILITATNQKREADPKLAPYEAELQRNLPLSSFRYVGEGVASVAAGGQAKISLAKGHRLELEGEKGGSGGLPVKVRWMNGNNVVLNTGLTLQSGVPAVLGRRPSDDKEETPIVLVIAK